MVQPPWKTLQQFIKKLEVELPYDPATLVLGIYLEEPKARSQRDICTSMFITPLFTTVKMWKQDFPGGALVKNPPANAVDTGSSPVLGRSHMPRSN